MSDRIRVIGGPLDGSTVGPWATYPDRIVLEYDCLRNPAALQLVSLELSQTGAERLVAEYNFDHDWKAYSFAGWTVQRFPPEPPGRT